MRVQVQVLYAFDLIHELHSVEAKNPGEKVKTAYLSDKLGISESFVRNILSLLSHAEILFSIRGAGGGFRIKKKLEDITVGDVIYSVYPSLDSESDVSEGLMKSNTSLSEAFVVQQKVKNDELLQMTLKQIYRKAEKK